MAPHTRQSHPNVPTRDGPPYPPQFQSLGEVPSVVPDVPVNVIFLCLFLGAGIAHFRLLQTNKASGKKFLISAMIGIFCLTRVIATCLRIAWACHPGNIQVGITAMVFVYAGIVLLFLANLFFAQRIVRAQHPSFGWSKPFTISLPILFVVTIGTVLCLVAAVIVSFYTTKPYSQHAAREIQKFGSTLLAIVAFLPFAIIGISSAARIHPKIRMTKTTDKFGEGTMRAKVAIVMVSAGLLCLGAWFRAGTILKHPVPIMIEGSPPTPAQHPWYLSKACFYIFNFTIEIVVCLLWLGVRVDKRFYIPDGAQGPHSYAGGFVFAGEFGKDKKRVSNQPNNEQELGTPSLRRPSSFNSRVSWTESRRSSKIEQQTRRSNRISWGGVSEDDVQVVLGEDGKEIPYPAFAHSGKYGSTAADIGIEGVDREMGFDPKSGRWAVRPISTVSSARPTSAGSDA